MRQDSHAKQKAGSRGGLPDLSNIHLAQIGSSPRDPLRNKMTPPDYAAAARHPGIPGKALAILYLIAAAAPLLWACAKFAHDTSAHRECLDRIRRLRRNFGRYDAVASASALRRPSRRFEWSRPKTREDADASRSERRASQDGIGPNRGSQKRAFRSSDQVANLATCSDRFIPTQPRRQDSRSAPPRSLTRQGSAND